MGGLSSRTVIANAFSSLIILLYLYNEDNTSWLILGTTGLGLLIELWKVTRVMRISGAGQRSKKSKMEALTETLDARATSFLSKVLLPLVGLYGAYSIFFYEQKSMWSWAIETAAHAVYTLGFIVSIDAREYTLATCETYKTLCYHILRR